MSRGWKLGQHQTKEHISKRVAKQIGQKRSIETCLRLASRPKECYKKPIVTSIVTDEPCEYGCGQNANYKFKNNKLCCSISYNSCPRKRKDFSERVDHKETAAKGLATKIRLGITKTSSDKAQATMIARGSHDIIRKKLQLKWQTTPWQNNTRCPLLQYKDTKINFQGSHEYKFLEKLETEFGIEWLEQNVRRGPTICYIDPTDNIKRLYLSDFIIGNTIYEIKSHWTWNKKDKDLISEKRNKAKLAACIEQSYKVKLILDGVEINYE